MKKTLIAAVIGASIFVGSATAQTGLYLNNQHGGVIGFTDTPCANGTSYAVYSTAGNRGGKMLLGCYAVDVSANLIVVRWNDGDLYTYPLSAARVNQDYQPAPRKR